MIKNLPILNSDDQKILDSSISHDWSIPEYKIKHFVIGSQIHPLHKIKQYLMELNSRQDSLESFENEVLKTEIEIELEEERKLDCKYESEKKLIDLEIGRKRKYLKISNERLRHALIERDKFLRLIKEFNESSEGKDEENVLYMDVLLNNPEKCEKIEKEYWEYRLAKQSAMDMIAYGRIGVGNMDAVLQLDEDSQQKCLAMAYEALILNESRMNIISDKVQENLLNGNTISNISNLLNMPNSKIFPSMLENKIKEDDNVSLIQKC